MQNRDVGMTREVYIEMCEALGDPIIEENIPPDFQDFPEEIQNSIQIYGYLNDNWDYMNGNYIGKDFNLLFKLFELLEVTERAEKRLIFETIKYLDSIRHKIIQNKKPPSTKKT